MPYGLPSAVTLSKDCEATLADQSKKLALHVGLDVFPQYPGADQDGWNDEWICKIRDSEVVVAIRSEDLK